MKNFQFNVSTTLTIKNQSRKGKHDNCSITCCWVKQKLEGLNPVAVDGGGLKSRDFETETGREGKRVIRIREIKNRVLKYCIIYFL